MKKLKLIGIKKGWFGREIQKIVADIYVQDGKVVVESKDQKEKEKLQKAINDRLEYPGAFGIRKSRDIKDKRGIVTELYQITQKPGDPQFLEALTSAFGFWHDKKFGDYQIIPTISKIIEE
ncbi:hypothetical protein HZB05_01535 [Candidatus Wolfebacteria bacterium]|nr:hypothetical protein [Candidatus Wolfebacteria bacterium]